MGVRGDFAGLEDLKARFSELATSDARLGLSQNLAEEARHQVDEGFVAGRDPYGRPWKPIASRTGRPLRDTGRLLNSLAPKARESGFTVSTAVIYAGVHQYGAIIKPKNAHRLVFRVRGKPTKRNRRGELSPFIFAKQVTIPQRQYMPEGSVGPIWGPALERAADRYVVAMLGAKGA